jgi:hypothetical protein
MPLKHSVYKQFYKTKTLPKSNDNEKLLDITCPRNAKKNFLNISAGMRQPIKKLLFQ